MNRHLFFECLIMGILVLGLSMGQHTVLAKDGAKPTNEEEAKQAESSSSVE